MFSMCIYACHVSMWVHVQFCAYEGKRLVLGDFFSCFHFIFIRQGLSLIWLGKLTHEPWDSLVSPVLGSQMHNAMPSFIFILSGDSNSGPHAHETSTLATELGAQPKVISYIQFVLTVMSEHMVKPI